MPITGLQYLDAQLEGPIANERIPAAGCLLSSHVLRAFATELALKALYSKETGSEPPKNHDLSRLFGKLSPVTQTALESRFQRIRRTKLQYRDQTDSLSAVLEARRNDFESLRYPYENADGEEIRQLILRSVIEAVKEEFDSSDADAGDARQVFVYGGGEDICTKA